jgi:UDP-perosamine 4-acetyltransferase
MDVVVIGAGGHARVCVDALVHSGHRVLGVRSSDPPIAGLELPWLGDDLALGGDGCERVFVAIGDNSARERVARRAAAAGLALVVARGDGAVVSPTAVVAAGVLLAPNAVVNAAARIGEGAIVNTAAVVEHDCEVGEFAHLAPGSILGGGVRVGALALVGLGARVLPGVTVGERAIVGAGAVVVGDVAPGTTVKGVPAR